MAKRRKKKLNRKLMFVLVGGAAVLVVGAVGFFVLQNLMRDPTGAFNQATALHADAMRVSSEVAALREEAEALSAAGESAQADAKNAEADEKAEESDSLWGDGGHSFQQAVQWTRKDIQRNVEYRMAFAAFLQDRLKNDPNLTDVDKRSVRGGWAKQIEAVINADPKHIESRQQMAQLKWDIASASARRLQKPSLWMDFAEAAEELAPLTPEDAGLFSRIAHAYVQLTESDKKYYKPAIEALAAAVGVDPANPDNYRQWASFLLVRNSMEGMPDTLSGEGARTVEDVSKAIEKLIEAKLADRDVSGRDQGVLTAMTAMDVYTFGLSLNPESVPLHVDLSQYLHHMGDAAGSAAQFETALAVANKGASDLLAIALHHLQFGEGTMQEKFDRALDSLLEARRADPTLMDVYTQLALVYRSQRKHDLAEQVCRDGLAVMTKELGDADPADLEMEDRFRYIKSRVELYANLGQALISEMPEDAALKQQRLEEVQTCLDRVHEYIAHLEDGRLGGVMFRLQLDVTALRADLARLQGELFEAQRLYRLAFDANPSLNLTLAQRLMELYMRHGESSEAERILAVVTKNYPKNIPALIYQAQLQLNRRDADLAEETLKRLSLLDLTEEQKASVAKMRQVVLLIRGADVPEAAMPVAIAATEVPRWLVYVQRLVDEGEVEQAIEVAEKLFKQFPTHPDVVGRLLALYERGEQTDKALAVVNTALAADPDSEKLRYFKEMLSASATERIEKRLAYIQQHTDGVERELQLADFYSASGLAPDRAKEIEHLAQAVELDPRAGDSLDRLFNEYMRDDRTAEATSLAEKAAALNLQGTGGRYYEARLLVAQSKWDEAVTLLLEALEMRPKFSRGHALLGKAYLGAGDFDKAIGSFTTSYEQNQRNVMAMIGLATLAQVQGRAEEHEMWVYRAYPHAPHVALVRRAWLNYQQKKVDAREFLSDCVNLYKRYPDDPVVLLKTAEAYEALPIPVVEKAGQIYRHLYEIHKDSPQMLFYLEKLAMHLQANDAADEAEQLVAGIASDAEHRVGYCLMQAKLLVVGGRHADARAMIDKAIEAAPADPRGYRFLKTWALDAPEKDWPAAVEAMEKLLELAPDDSRIWNETVETLMRAGMFDKAAEKVRQRLDAAPDDPEVIAMLGQVYYVQDRLEDALAMCDKAVKIDSRQVRALMLRSDIYMSRGEADKSVADLEAAYRARPSVRLAVALAQRHVKAKEDWERAKQTLEEALAKNEDSVPLLQELGVLCVKTRNWSELGETIRRGLKAQPRLPVWSVLEAQMWKTLEKPDKRTAALMKAYEMAPQNISVTLVYLDALLESKRYTDAMKVVAGVNRRISASSQVLLKAGAGRANIALGAEEQGLQDFQRAFYASRTGDVCREVFRHLLRSVGDERGVQLVADWLRARDHAAMRLVLGDKLIELGQDAVAEQILAGAELSPATKSVQFEILRQLGVVRSRLDKNELAREAYEEAVKLHPNDSLVLNNLACLLAEKLDAMDTAIGYAKRAAALQPMNPNVADTLGWVYYQANDLDKARRQLEHSLQLGQTSAGLYHLGLVHQKQNRPEKARDLFQRGFDLVRDNPQDPFYDELKESLGL